MNIHSPLLEPLKTFAPQNDAEALEFIDRWCEHCRHCQHDKYGVLLKHSCRILHKADCNDEFSTDYPIEWQRDTHNQGRCVAFEDKNQIQQSDALAEARAFIKTNRKEAV